MPSTGYRYAGTGNDDSTVGTTSWTNIANITGAPDNTGADSLVNPSNTDAAVDNSVRLYVNGAFLGTDKKDGVTNWPTAGFATVTYGAVNDLWGTDPSTLNPALTQLTDFGCGISAKDTVTSVTSHYARGSNYGFSFSGIINGIQVQITRYNNFGAFCFIAGTLISTPRGNIPIEDIRDGDEVYSWHNGEMVVCIVHGCGNTLGPVMEVITEQGNVTAGIRHPFFTNRDWQDVKSLHIGDSLFKKDGKFITPVPFRDKIGTGPEGAIAMERIYFFEVMESHNYFANGFLTHNTVVPIGFTDPQVDAIGINITYTLVTAGWLPLLGCGS